MDEVIVAKLDQIIDMLSKKTHTVKEEGYENEPCYQRECSNPSKHTNGLHIGSEGEEEPTTPEKKCWN